MSYSKDYYDIKDASRSVKKYLTEKNAQKKIDAYRHKLISTLVANDKERFIETMLQLSSYTETPFSFLHSLIVDFDKNKNLAYDFVNSLNFFELNKNNKGENNNEK